MFTPRKTHLLLPQEAEQFTAQLTRFRRKLEEESGEPVEGMEVNAALLLLDVSKFMGLNETQACDVLGKSAAAHVAVILETQVKLKN